MGMFGKSAFWSRRQKAEKFFVPAKTIKQKTKLRKRKRKAAAAARKRNR